jgi:uncharacterized membrane protein
MKARGFSADASGGLPPAARVEDPTGDRLDKSIARILSIGTYAGVALLAAGFLIMVLTGRSPLDSHPPVDVGQLPGDLVAGRLEGAVFLGLLVLIATPSARVVASLVGYLRAGERGMVVVSAAILVVVAAGVVVGVALGETAG